MPHYDGDITHATRSIIRVTSEQVVEKVLRYIGIEEYFDNNVYFNDGTQAASYHKTKDGKVKTASNDRLDIEIEPVFNINDTKAEMPIAKFIHSWNSNKQKVGTVILEDRERKISVLEYGAPLSVTLNFNMRLGNVEKADTVNMRINNRIGVQEVITYTSLIYSYPLPDTILVGLNLLYNNKKFNYSSNFFQYVNEVSDGQIGLEVNRDKPDNSTTMVQKQANYVSVFHEFGFSKPEGNEINKLNQSYSIELTCTYQLYLPTFNRILYPVSINNEMIDDRLLLRKGNIDMQDFEGDIVYDTDIGYYLLQKESEYRRKHRIPRSIVYPNKDTWRPPTESSDVTIHSRQFTLFQSIVFPEANYDLGYISVDANLSETYLKILDDNNQTSIKEVIEIFLDDEDNIDKMKNKQCPIRIQIFEDGYQIPNEHLQITKSSSGDYIVHTDQSYQVKEDTVHHVLIGLNNDVQEIDEEYTRIMLEHPELFSGIIYNNLNHYVNTGLVEVVGKNDAYYHTDNLYTNSADNIFRVLNVELRLLR